MSDLPVIEVVTTPVQVVEVVSGLPGAAGPQGPQGPAGPATLLTVRPTGGVGGPAQTLEFGAGANFSDLGYGVQRVSFNAIYRTDTLRAADNAADGVWGYAIDVGNWRHRENGAWVSHDPAPAPPDTGAY